MAVKKGKQRKKCEKCGEENLAWGTTPEGWRLFKGEMRGGKWEASTERHNCVHDGGHGEGNPRPQAPQGDVVVLACSCGYRLQAEREQVLKFGYPICSTCESFMMQGEIAQKKASELTPDEVVV